MPSQSFVERFIVNREYHSVKPAIISLEGSGEMIYTYDDIHAIMSAKMPVLSDIPFGSLVLLLYEDTVDFLTSFLACQHLGLICVPMFFPKNKRHVERLKGIIQTSQCQYVLTSKQYKEKVEKDLREQELSTTVFTMDFSSQERHTFALPKPHSISFIQYTSGSTSDPKGVIISQQNLMHNQKMLADIFQCDEDSVILSWLPFYHDMGLIGSLLHTLYTGCTCIVMKPSSVVNDPLKWLQMIEKYKVTHTGGPNFIYDLCNGLNESQKNQTNLSSLIIMYNGSEVVKPGTVALFIQEFERVGFNPSAYRTCYGLAEATLVVSGGLPEFTEGKIASGTIGSELEVLFYQNETQEIHASSGEICVFGESITEGYWQMNSLDLFIVHEGKKYLKTGDMGRIFNGQLYVEGRLKEMLIINGANIFPYDLELNVAALHNAFSVNGVCVSEEDGKLYVFVEVGRAYVNLEPSVYADLRLKIDKELIDTIGTEAIAVVFVSPRSLPRTSSGKIRRTLMIKLWRDKILNEVGNNPVSVKTEQFNLELFDWSEQAIENYLTELIRDKLRIGNLEDIQNTTLFELGMSSLKAFEIVNKINTDLEIELSMESVFKLNDVKKVCSYIMDLKWLTTNVSEDKEIEL